MKLSQCTHGILVTFGSHFDEERVGMIVGITNNAELSDVVVRDQIEHAVPLVKWSGRTEPVGVHHGNLSVFKG